MIRMHAAIISALFFTACSPGSSVDAQARLEKPAGDFITTEIGRFNQPWAMAWLPDGKSALITEKSGNLKLWVIGGSAITVSGTPKVDAGGQGGLGDVVLHPQFAANRWVYLSYVEPGNGDTRGAVVARAKLNVTKDGSSATLEGLEIVWRQSPKTSGRGHYGHRIAFSPDGHMFIASGERQKFDPAQDMNSNLGKILRLKDDGSVPSDNPFAKQGGIAAQIWSLGHRNPLGLAFDASGQLWDMEMGPKGGDELNKVMPKANYGYPTVSNGDHYDGTPIPDHYTRPEFAAPAISWTPVISPAGLIFYSGTAFPAWRGSAFVPGLSSKAIIRIAFEDDTAREVERYDMGVRIRAVTQGPDGALWVLEDGSDARLLKLTPR